MHNLSTLFTGIALIAAILALVWSTFTAIYARNCSMYVRKSNVQSATLKKLTEIETTLTDHHDSISNLHTMHKKLRSRIGMRDLAKRREAEALDTAPDPKEDPEGWKRFMRQQLHLKQSG